MITIQQDSREKGGKKQHILSYFESNGINVVRSKLFVGDYTLLNKQDVCIDLKQDILEVSGNIQGKNHERFKQECIRSKENGIKLIVLIEEEFSIDTLCNWKSPTIKNGKRKGEKISKASGETLAKCMKTMTEKYGVEFMFCKKEDTGKFILKILTGGV